MSNEDNKDDIYDAVDEAGLPPVNKAVELVDRVFTIMSLRLTTYVGEDGKSRDSYIATVQLDGREDLYRIGGVAVMPKLERLIEKKGMPIRYTLKKVKAGKGMRYDLQRPPAPTDRPGEKFDREQGGGA